MTAAHPFSVRLLLSVLGVCWTFHPSLAGTYEAKSGQVTPLTTLSRYDAQRCSILAPPKFKIVQPEHGEIKAVWDVGTLEKGHCKGKKMKVLWLVYRSNSGFVGIDRGAVNYTALRYSDDDAPQNVSDAITINVR